ncbi:glycosyltransferase [Candidatus Woesearchaeota archaeon]|nr:MAG: family 2 glycosyl transferase [archaeon GW2011_AR18]MBS3161125.1 glycosyltransferase [Candidatus Woesearchaeota archaeon]HIH25535.1 glycosyltransferase [Nanoarchaeota archaeon]
MISIIIPACNEEKYLLDTIKSIKSQSFKDFEIIVVCDGCTDNTPLIAKKHSDKVILNKERNGPTRPKNLGAKKSSGDILVFLDADTHLTKDVLKKINEVSDKIIVGTCKIKPSNNKFKHRLMMSLKNNILCPFGVSNGIIFCKKNDFFKYNGFNEKLKKGEDGHFVRLLKKKGRFIILKNHVISSTRRFDSKGYIRTFGYWLREYFNPSNDDYEIIR